MRWLKPKVSINKNNPSSSQRQLGRLSTDGESPKDAWKRYEFLWTLAPFRLVIFWNIFWTSGHGAVSPKIIQPYINHWVFPMQVAHIAWFLKKPRCCRFAQAEVSFAWSTWVSTNDPMDVPSTIEAEPTCSKKLLHLLGIPKKTSKTSHKQSWMK